jgi:hypothetical protein
VISLRAYAKNMIVTTDNAGRLAADRQPNRHRPVERFDLTRD